MMDSSFWHQLLRQKYLSPQPNKARGLKYTLLFYEITVYMFLLYLETVTTPG